MGLVRKKFAFFANLLILTGFGFILSSCTVKMRNSPLALLRATNSAQPFTYAWPFDFNTTSSYAYDPIKIDFTGGVCRLTPTNQIDNSNAAAGFGGGSMNGAIWNGSNSFLKLDVAANSSGQMTTTNWTPRPGNLIGLWHFDEASGISVSDSANSNIGTLSASVALGSVGKFGNAANFTGGTGGAGGGLITAALSPALTASFSVHFWMNPTSQGTPVYLSNGVWLLYINGIMNRFSAFQPAAATVALNNWTQVVYVYDSVASNESFYINGKKVATQSGVSLGGSTSVRFGQYSTGTWGYNGLLDEMAIWNTVLNDSEIKTLYERQVAKYTGIVSSRVMDALATSQSWTTLSWIPTLPFFKALPDYFAGAIQNETSTDYTSLVGSTGNVGDNDLMSGIVGLWHLDEGLGSLTARNDSDGSVGTASNITFAKSGKILASASFNGTSSEISTSIPTTSTTYSQAAWVNPANLSSIITILGSAWSGCMGKPFKIYTDGKIGLANGCAGDFKSTGSISPNTWSHVAVTVSAGMATFYINGQASGTYAGPVNAGGSPTWVIGQCGYGCAYFNGSLDEVAMWSRALNPTEILQLYRRGANRVKHQVRTCLAADCSDDLVGANWKGPDGTNQTYFTELNNNTVPLAMTGTVQKTLPTMLFSNFTNPVATSRYFQYRTILESDDTGTACNYGSGPTWCSPELKSVTVDPVHYDNSAPSVIGKTGVPFSSLSSFVETLGASCASGIGYNLGIGSSYSSATWYYWNGSAWVAANGTAAQASSAATISTNGASFGTVAATGTVFFKAFLKSSGTSKCELDQLDLSGVK